jgi:hypothetical protein
MHQLLLTASDTPQCPVTTCRSLLIIAFVSPQSQQPNLLPYICLLAKTPGCSLSRKCFWIWSSSTASVRQPYCLLAVDRLRERIRRQTATVKPISTSSSCCTGSFSSSRSLSGAASAPGWSCKQAGHGQSATMPSDLAVGVLWRTTAGAGMAELQGHSHVSGNLHCITSALLALLPM